MRALRFLVVVALAAGLTGGTAEAQDRKARLLQRAAEVAKICAEHMPNSVAAKEAFKAAGFRYEGLEPPLHIYSLEGRRLVAATTVTSEAQQACMISVSGMTVAEATVLIQPWVEVANARSIPPWRDSLAATWQGTFKGGPIRLGIFKQLDFNIMRGAAIAAVSVN